MTAAEFKRFAQQAHEWLARFQQIDGVLKAAAEADALLETVKQQEATLRANVESLEAKQAAGHEAVAAVRVTVEQAKQDADAAIHEAHERVEAAQREAQEAEGAAGRARAAAQAAEVAHAQILRSLEQGKATERALLDRIRELQQTLEAVRGG